MTIKCQKKQFWSFFYQLFTSLIIDNMNVSNYLIVWTFRYQLFENLAKSKELVKF